MESNNKESGMDRIGRRIFTKTWWNRWEGHVMAGIGLAVALILLGMTRAGWLL
jgi:hypothetical protein